MHDSMSFDPPPLALPDDAVQTNRELLTLLSDQQRDLGQYVEDLAPWAEKLAEMAAEPIADRRLPPPVEQELGRQNAVLEDLGGLLRQELRRAEERVAELDRQMAEVRLSLPE